MSEDQPTERARALRSIPILTGLVGAVLLAGGVVLALYSQFVAAPIPVPFHGDFTETADFPFRLVRAALVVAGAAALIGAVVLVLGRRGDERAASVGAGGALAILFVLGGGLWFAVAADIPSTYQRLTSDFVVTPRASSAIAALALAISGALLTFVFVVQPTGPVPRWWALAAALVVGVIPVLGAAGFAVRFGDDSVSSDHLTAEAAPEIAAPAVLGSEKFRLQIPADPDLGHRILVTRSGFVVATPAGLAHYDGATGTERWRYLRGNISTDSVWNRLDDTTYLRAEDVVLTKWRNIGWMAFDAATGELLWTGEDFADDPRSTTGGHLLATISSETGRVTRYDARTGREMWSIAGESAKCTAAPSQVGTTMTAIYRVARCGDGEAATVVVTAFDPMSGEVRDTRSFPTPAAVRAMSTGVRVFDSGFVWVECHREGAVDTEIFLPPNVPLSAAIVDSSREYSDLEEADSTSALVSSDNSDPNAGLGDRWEVLSAVGEVLWTELEMTTPATGAMYVEDRAELLADRVVVLILDDGFELRSWDRSTGREGPAVPITIGPDGDPRVTTTSGSLIVIASDRNGRGSEIIGFG
ncbi:outer membrane protein assembly factor BamB family protein [Nocardia caishijiensis]|uniref:Pyrroloquinoline-quinone binding quinoprotein n=1 Tax=Nocardia caishijiensis TaxID=184756 RepID=A0ABQ6YLG4_9NOCA|nr:PQQ-binding-like beta-propeller repeat protein [Nocardia caishijiensis]KAF0846561.1 putative pyrroloquinoline-quinone binding quinoprotein [Nocardia caishijiensis]